MMEINWLVVFTSALIPMIIGYLWYSVLFEKAWMKSSGMSMEKIETGNMLKIYGFALLFAVFLALGLMQAVIHQIHVFAVLQNVGVNEAGSEAATLAADFMKKYGTEFRTFKHGALHGFVVSLLIIFPALATNAFFEHKSWKYIFINAGYWAVSALLMGGVISAWA